MRLTAQKMRELARDLEHADPLRRRTAAEMLAVGDERVLLPLIKALRDENQGVQDAAMRSLISIGGEATAYMVLPLLRDEVAIRNMAVIILREIGGVAAPLLCTLMRDKDDDVRKFALDLICDIGECRTPDVLTEILRRDPNPNVRVSAAKAIGVLRLTEAAPALVDALRDTEWVSFAALEALSAAGDDGSVEAVAELLMSPGEVIRSEAITCLASIGTEKALGTLRAHLEWEEISDYEKTLTVKSLLAAGIVPEVKGIGQILLDTFINGEWDEKMLALKELAARKEEKAVFHVVDAVGSLDPSSPDYEGRIEEIKDALKSFDCAPLLVSLLKDGRLKFRGMTFLVELLGEMGEASAVPVLEAMQTSSIYVLKKASSKALALIGGRMDGQRQGPGGGTIPAHEEKIG